MKLYKVGGWVRDTIMGVRSKDLDLAMEAPSYDVMRSWIIENGYEIFEERPQFQTIRSKHSEFGPVDIVLCRKERDYQDGRRPSEVEVGDIYDDLQRRDFSVNAIAIDTDTGQYIDPHNGIQDIQDRLIRCVGHAEDRFKEDSLRLLRAIRFSITKGFSLHDDIVICLNDSAMIKSLDNAKVERWYEELKKCFEKDTLKTLRTLEGFPKLRDKVFTSPLWLKLPKLMPTMEQRKGHQFGVSIDDVHQDMIVVKPSFGIYGETVKL